MYLISRKSAKTQDRLKCVRPEVEEPPSPKVSVLMSGTDKQTKTKLLSCLFVFCLFVSLVLSRDSIWRQSSLQRDPKIPAGSPSLRDGAPCSPSDVASLKLVRYLQERVKQLRVENDTCSWSLSPSRPAVPCDLSGSCPSTVRSLLLILLGFFFLSLTARFIF